jgi:hypothetical protein
MKYGYARVSSDGQSVDAQVRQLAKAGCKKVFREIASGAKTDRAQLRLRSRIENTLFGEQIRPRPGRHGITARAHRKSRAEPIFEQPYLPAHGTMGDPRG